MGLKKLPAEPAEGRSKQVWADLARKSGPLEARGWRVDWVLNVHGAQDWPGLRVDPVVGHGLPTQRAAPLRLQGSGRAWRQVSDSASDSGSEVQRRLARSTLGRGLRIQAQMSKDLLDYRPLQDGGDDLELPGATVRAALHVDVKHPLEQPCQLMRAGRARAVSFSHCCSAAVAGCVRAALSRLKSTQVRLRPTAARFAPSC